MKKMRVVIGSNDGKNIILNHLGESEYFYIYDIFEDGTYNYIEKRENISPEEDKNKHGLDKKRNIILNICKDANVFVGRMMSPNFINIAKKTEVQPVIIKEESISGMFNILAKYFEDIYNLVQARHNGERPQKIPKIE